eukprot:COSAG04_NODE_2617_length_3848_cov_2.473460_3_plen_93_part_00
MLRISIIPVHSVLQDGWIQVYWLGIPVGTVSAAAVTVHLGDSCAIPHAICVPRLHLLPDFEDPAASRRRPRSVLVVRLLPVQPDIICDSGLC